MGTYSVKTADGAEYEVEAPDENAALQALGVGGQPEPQASAPQAPAQQPSQGIRLPGLHGGVVGVADAGLSLGSSAVAAPVAGLAGLISAPFVGPDKSADIVRGLQGGLTYQPRTQVGQLLTGVVAYPFEKLAQGADWVGQQVANVTDSPAAGAVTNTAVQALPAVLLRGLGRGKAAAPTSSPQAAAEAYARSIGLDWSALSDTVKARLAHIATDPRALHDLDKAAVARQAQLESMPIPVPATRGQLTRDPVQLRNEGNASATEGGRAIRDIYVQQNKALLDNLEVLKGRTRGRADSPEQVGASVQGAARAALELQKQKVSDLYKQAETTGELQNTVSIKPILDVLAQTPDKTHYAYARAWMSHNRRNGDLASTFDQVRVWNPKEGFVIEPRVGPPNKMTIKQLEDLRQAAVAKAMNGGTDGYYAGKLISAIDQATEGAGGQAYKAARAARKAQAMQFEEQAGVARLVENKSRTDRATALEDTWRKTVIGGSIEDLRNVKRTLLTGGDTATRTAGRQAWRDMQAQTIQHIIHEATKSVARFEDGTPNVTPAAMQKAINSVGTAKLNEVFGPGTVQQINKIMQATRDVKTEPPPGFKGSPTFANAIAFLEGKLGKIPLVGNTAAGVVQGVVKLNEMGRIGRQVKEAQKTPLATQPNALAPISPESKNALRKNAGALAVPIEERSR